MWIMALCVVWQYVDLDSMCSVVDGKLWQYVQCGNMGSLEVCVVW